MGIELHVVGTLRPLRDISLLNPNLNLDPNPNREVR